jgi:hypothetical protein
MLYSVIAGLGVRLALAPFTAHPFDMYVFYLISRAIVGGGTVTSTKMGYIPMEYYTLVPVSYLYFYLSGVLSIHPQVLSSMPGILQSAASWTIPKGTTVPLSTDWFYNLVEKTPLIIADLVGGIVLYRIVLPLYGERIASYAFILWFLNPMLIWVSAVWGMFDTLPALFTLLATYFLLRGSFLFSALSLSIATGYKLYPIFLAVPLFVYGYRSTGSLKKMVAPIALCISMDTGLFFPGVAQVFSTTIQYLAWAIGNPSKQPWQTFGLTYWSLAPLLPISGGVVSLLSTASLVILGLCFSTLAVLKMRKENSSSSSSDLFFWELVSLSAIFFSYRAVAEQWFIWILPFLILLLAGKAIGKGFVVGLSVLAMLYSWTNSLFIAFFLPLSKYNTSVLEVLARASGSLTSYRLDLMASFGTLFTIFFTLCIFSSNYKRLQWNWAWIFTRERQ